MEISELLKRYLGFQETINALAVKLSHQTTSCLIVFKEKVVKLEKENFLTPENILAFSEYTKELLTTKELVEALEEDEFEYEIEENKREITEQNRTVEVYLEENTEASNNSESDYVEESEMENV